MYCRFCTLHNECTKERDNYDLDDYTYRMDQKNKCEVADLKEAIIAPSTFKLSYPFIENICTEEAKNRINNEIITMLLSLLKGQVIVAENIDYKEIISFYKVPLNEKGLLSILFGIYTFTGGAHGYTYYDSLTMDIESGKVYKFSDLFNPKIYYVGFLNDIIKKYISDNNIPIIEDFNGINPESQKFYLTPDSLVLYYQVYEYTPYAYGLFEVKIPYTEIINLLGPLSPIQKLLP